MPDTDSEPSTATEPSDTDTNASSDSGGDDKEPSKYKNLYIGAGVAGAIILLFIIIAVVKPAQK
jgi:hypothetical protein